MGLNLARRWTLLVISAGRLSAYRQKIIIADRKSTIADLVKSFGNFSFSPVAIAA